MGVQINRLSETEALAKGDQLLVLAPNSWRGFFRAPINLLISLLSGGVFTYLSAEDYVAVPGVPFASLPDPVDAGAGARATCTDLSAIFFNDVAAGGGSDTRPVFSDGTDWRVG